MLQNTLDILKLGKNNKKIVKKLLKVVIDDIEYEISCTIDYVKDLQKEINRYKEIEKYINKKNASTKKKHIVYYEQYIDLLLRPGESIEDFNDLYQEAKDAYQLRKNILNDLHKEIKNVKKLHV
ncbi:MAG: hypothetical protein V8R51_06915 [Clostridia bacterium]